MGVGGIQIRPESVRVVRYNVLVIRDCHLVSFIYVVLNFVRALRLQAFVSKVLSDSGRLSMSPDDSGRLRTTLDDSGLLRKTLETTDDSDTGRLRTTLDDSG